MRAAPVLVWLALLACREPAPPVPKAEEAGRSLPRALAAAAPGWTSLPPRVETRDGRRYAVAVGKMVGVSNTALARAGAEERARVLIAGLIKAKNVQGAAITRTYEAADGRVFVELELPLRR